MLEFVLERANYWAIIGLMMVGLYITFQATNMIKRLVGLSIFQTSVFLFYITLGKVAGGSAPILYGKDAKGHGSEKAAHGTAAVHGNTPNEHADASTGLHSEANETNSALEGVDLQDVREEALQSVPVVDDGSGRTALDEADILELVEHSADLHATGLAEIYSNPLPHVLILTAIVVGVATLAVGLAIVVRIRECYGSIEGDEVRQMDIETADAQDADDPVRGLA